jgi:hypothetical protein
MVTDGEKYQRLVNFLKESFRATELDMFLQFIGIREVSGAVNRDVGLFQYAFEVVQALDHRVCVSKIVGVKFAIPEQHCSGK